MSPQADNAIGWACVALTVVCVLRIVRLIAAQRPVGDDRYKAWIAGITASSLAAALAFLSAPYAPLPLHRNSIAVVGVATLGALLLVSGFSLLYQTQRGSHPVEGYLDGPKRSTSAMLLCVVGALLLEALVL